MYKNDMYERERTGGGASVYIFFLREVCCVSSRNTIKGLPFPAKSLAPLDLVGFTHLRQ